MLRILLRRRLGNPPPPNEALRTQRARLLFQSRKHGLKELEFIFNRFAMKHLNGMDKEQLDQYDCILNHPANEWLVFFWVTGVLDLPPELKGIFVNLSRQRPHQLISDNGVLSQLQKEMQNSERVNMARRMFDEYDRLGMDFSYQSAVKTNPL